MFTSKLPYVIVPQLKAKFLIDTGSSRCLIDPNLAYEFYKNFICNENFYIQSAHNISSHNEVADIPIFKIFNVKLNHKFHLFKFSQNYEGLIGIDLLKKLNATVNVADKLLETPHASIPIILDPIDQSTMNKIERNQTQIYSIIIEPRCHQVVKLPVNLREGIGILNYKNFKNGIEMPKAVVNVKNNLAITTLTNCSEKPVKLEIYRPLDIENLNNIEINFVEKMETDDILTNEQDDLLKQNLKNLRLDHLNYEEKEEIRRLCFDYRDIFYCEGIPLTFTNKITHKINLKNDAPIYTKS